MLIPGKQLDERIALFSPTDPSTPDLLATRYQTHKSRFAVLRETILTRPGNGPHRKVEGKVSLLRDDRPGPGG